MPLAESLQDAVDLLGHTSEPAVQSSLSAWGPAGERSTRLNEHVLNGPNGDPAEAYEVCRQLFDLRSWIWSNADQPSDLAKESMIRWWLFLLAGRMRPAQIDLLWPDGFFHGVEGHDPVLEDSGYYRLVRSDGGSISSALKFD